jgi:hypothetical protein
MARRIFAAAFAALASLASHPTAEAQECVPPRILFVVDASSSMLGEIDQTTKWEAAQAAVETVLNAYPSEAEYGLMLFPGAAGQCSTGEVKVDVAQGTGSQIVGALQSLFIPTNNQTPAGQTLMAASQYPLITDPGYANHVIFVTDGYQYCSVGGGTACATQSDCTAMGESSCPSCLPDTNDGCYCVQHWPVLGAEGLFSAGVATYVVGFGSSVNFQALNMTAFAGGTSTPGCDPMSDMPSCYFQATMPQDLTMALGQIVMQVVTDTCVGACGIEGEKTCTPSGWSECDSPDSVSCLSTCGTPGLQQCVGDALTECSSEIDCGEGGAGGSPTTSTTSGVGGSGAVGGSGDTSNRDDDPGEEGGCACRAAGGNSHSGQLLWLALGAALGLARRRSR